MFHADTFPSFPLGLVDLKTRLRLGMHRRACSVSDCLLRTRIAGRAEAELQPSPCEKAYADATANADIMADRSRHIIMRYLAAQEAVSDWANTAAYCPARFADGTLRSAQARSHRPFDGGATYDQHRTAHAVTLRRHRFV